MPDAIAALPRNARGYPVPFFVAYVDGKPDFRLVRPETLHEAVERRLCWICGQPLGAQGTFVLGPMCCVNRANSEPPSHRKCAEFAVQACPFMLRPEMERREDETTGAALAGVMIKRNPGVMALWTSKHWTRFDDGQGKGKQLFNVGDPRHVSWWREGRTASAREVYDSIMTGLPELIGYCHSKEERADLQVKLAKTLKLVDKTV